MQARQAGFSLAEIIIAVVIISILGLGWLAMAKSQEANQANTQTAPTPTPTPAPNTPHNPTWTYADYSSGWQYKGNGNPPNCPSPLLANSPVDTSLASEILYPGQYRGTHYKAHGGFQFAYRNSNQIDVWLPIDGYLTGVTKYLDTPETDPQYILTFINSCGIMVRFDHLHTLTPEFATIADTLPLQTDTRGLPSEQPYGFFKAGTKVATGAGPRQNIIGGGFDFGLYDLRQPNHISQNPQWVALHQNEAEQAFYGLCWIDYLPTQDKERVMQILPLATDDRGASDYCSFDAGGNTLDYNNGQPVLNHATPNRAR